MPANDRDWKMISRKRFEIDTFKSKKFFGISQKPDDQTQ
jgi:hypothetical protein